MNRITRFILMAVVVVAALSVLSVSNPVKAHPGQRCTTYHVVKPGDNLFRIGLAYNVTWTVLQHINGIYNPNQIYVGQIICYPPGAVPANPPIVVPLPPATPLPPAPPPASFFPPYGIYPRIHFNTYFARPGDTIVITGTNFPGPRQVQIFITQWGTNYAATASATATTNADGTLSTNFTVPNDAGGVPLVGAYLTVLVKDPVSGYFGYNTFRNTAF